MIAIPANMFWKLANMRYSEQVTQGILGSWQLFLFQSQKQCCPYLRCYLRPSMFKGDEEIGGAQVARRASDVDCELVNLPFVAKYNYPQACLVATLSKEKNK